MTPPDSPSPRTVPSTPLSPDEEAALRAKWSEFLDVIDPMYHPTGVVPRLLATLDAARAAQEAPAPEGLRRLSGYVTAPTPRARASAHIEYPDEPPMSPESIGWTGAGETEAEAVANLGRALAAAPPSPAEPPRPFDEADNMCPNCVTPWKCNGPHLSEQTAAHRAEARPPEGLNAAYETRLYVTADEIEAALKRLHGPVTRDEATIMAAAQAAADALRGGRIVAARLSARGAEPR